MLGGGESWNCFELWQQCSLKLANGARAIWSTRQQTILERRKPLFEMNGFHSALVPLSRSVWKVLCVTLLLFLRWLKALKNSHSSKLNRYVFWELSYYYYYYLFFIIRQFVSFDWVPQTSMSKCFSQSRTVIFRCDCDWNGHTIEPCLVIFKCRLVLSF